MNKLNTMTREGKKKKGKRKGKKKSRRLLKDSSGSVDIDDIED